LLDAARGDDPTLRGVVAGADAVDWHPEVPRLRVAAA
jgi:hypothetical protein